MADGDLHQADLDLAFGFARSESGAWRDGNGAAQVAAPNAPRFDHDADGIVRGLLISGGVEPGGGDRLTLDALILPAELLTAGVAGETTGTTADVTILHRFAAKVANDGDWAVERRAFYSRNVVAAIDALLGQAGHHLAIGVIPGFRLPTLAADGSGFVRYRGEIWRLPGLVAGDAAGTPLGADQFGGLGRALIEAGAQPAS